MKASFDTKFKQTEQINLDQKTKHKEEIQTLQKNYDTKLNQIEKSNKEYITQISTENQQKLIELKQQCQQQFEIEKTQLLETSKMTLASELMKTNQKLNQEKTDSIKALQTDYELKLEAVRTESKNRLDNSQQVLQQLQAQYQVLKEEKETLAAELNVRIESLQKALGKCRIITTLVNI